MKCDALLTLRDVADRLGCHPRSVYNLIRDHGFPAGILVGRLRRFDAAEVAQWIASRPAYR